jgi:hypothetical protein
MVVRYFVAMVGAEKAEQMARIAGASEARTLVRRRCVKSQEQNDAVTTSRKYRRFPP